MITATLNHIALDVADRDRGAAFYRDLLGAEIVFQDVERRITFLCLPGSRNLNDIALHENPDATPAPGQRRMAHTGWEVDSTDALVAAHDFFTARTRVVMAADFGGALSVMGLDPDGHIIEIQYTVPDREGTAPGFAALDVDVLRAASTRPIG